MSLKLIIFISLFFTLILSFPTDSDASENKKPPAEKADADSLDKKTKETPSAEDKNLKKKERQKERQKERKKDRKNQKKNRKKGACKV